MKALMIALAATLSISGCGSEEFDDDCSHQMDDLRRDHGNPLEIRRARSGDTHAEIWYYSNFSHTFTWTDGLTRSCESNDNR